MNHPEGTTGVPDQTPEVAKAVAAFNLMQMVAEAVVGYRAKLVEGGVGAEAADRMAEEYHTTLMDVMKSRMVGEVVKNATSAIGRAGGFPRRGH